MSAFQLPLQIDFGSVPENFNGTPQEFSDFLQENARFFSTLQFALFVTGTTAPTSNVGPWLANGNEWYVWSDGDGEYVPITINQESLGYFIGSATPDQNIYNFWIQTDVGGSPLALKIYYSGAWVDVYASQFSNYSTTTQMNAAIADAIASIPTFSAYPAQAKCESQTVAVDGTAYKVEFDTAVFNPAPAPFNTTLRRYIAPVAGYYNVSCSFQVDNDTGTASGMEVTVSLYKNGALLGNGMSDIDSTPSPNGSRWSPGFSGLVQLAQNDYIEIFIGADDGVNTGNVTVTVAQFSINRVSA